MHKRKKSLERLDSLKREQRLSAEKFSKKYSVRITSRRQNNFWTKSLTRWCRTLRQKVCHSVRMETVEKMLSSAFAKAEFLTLVSSSVMVPVMNGTMPGASACQSMSIANLKQTLSSNGFAISVRIKKWKNLPRRWLSSWTKKMKPSTIPSPLNAMNNW